MHPSTGQLGRETTGYPGHWSADVMLRDGRTAQLRPIRANDAERLVEFYARVSERSKYFRFFAPYPHLSERDVRRFTQVDHYNRVALVVTLGQAIAGVGRFDRIDDQHAEVAFLVEDAHQGRGVGQLLLEHLAEAARERGYARFVADVLPDNSRMIQVFREQGYQVAGGITDGVLRLEFPIDPTDTAVGVVQAREHRAEAASIRRFFDVRSVAVVGATQREDSIGQALVRHLLLDGFTGSVHAVNPNGESVPGVQTYASVHDVPGDVDLALVAVPADAVADVVLDCAAKGVYGLVVISAGFAEAGDEGWELQRRLLALTRSYGLRLVGPNCLGVINTAPGVRINASLSPCMPARGRVGFFCQSGALGVAILENVDRRGLGLSTFVSAGNRADVSGNDLLQYWEEDEATDVVLLYLESIGNPRKFARIARRVAPQKPIVAVRSRRTTQGVPVGHTGRHTSAPQAAVDAMFRQAGVILVDSLDEMFDVAQLLAFQPLPAGDRIAVIGNSDALGLLAADAATAAGLSVRVPVALGSDATAAHFEQALDAVIGDPSVDAIVAVYVPPLESTGEEVATVLATVGETSDKPIVSNFLGRQGVPELLRVPSPEGEAGKGSVPSYPAPEAAVRALAHVVAYAEWRRRPAGEVRAYPDVNVADARRVVEAALVAVPEGAELDQEQVGHVLAAYGIELWEQVEVDSADAVVEAGSRLGWEVVLKAHAERLRVRPDLSFVWRNIDGVDEARQAWATMTARLADPDDGRFVVQRQAAGGVPVTIEAVEDPLFGPLLSFGLAGAPIELLGDRAWRIPPVTDADTTSMLREIQSAPMLTGYRGAEPVDLAAVEDLVQRVSRLKHDLPQVSSIALSLVLAHVDGASVLEGGVSVAPTGATRRDLRTRRMARMPGDTIPS